MPSRIAGDCLSVVRGRGDVSPRVAAVEACRELRLSESAGVIVSTKVASRLTAEVNVRRARTLGGTDRLVGEV